MNFNGIYYESILINAEICSGHEKDLVLKRGDKTLTTDNYFSLGIMIIKIHTHYKTYISRY